MRIILPTLLLFSGLLICCGCGEVVPEELRQLYSVTVTVTDDSQPVEGVAVVLSSKGSQGAYGCNGVTNTKGVAKIQSTRSLNTHAGVPPGTYSVVLIETIELPPELVPDDEIDLALPRAAAREKRMKREQFLKEHQQIPSLLAISTSSPLELTVENSTVTLDVDISKYR